MSKHSFLYDLHLHTEFSPDSTTSLKTYAQVADKLNIYIGFLDHLELAFLNRSRYLNYERIPRLLEVFDQVHTAYPHTSIGLEVDYYSDLAAPVAEFCDDHRSDFDYLIGVVHTVDRFAVTRPDEMGELVNRFGLREVLKRYFHEVEAAIESRLFQGIAHIDGVMRFFPQYPGSSKLEPFWKQRTLELGLQCKKQDLLLEVNLRGLTHPWNKMHPSRPIINELLKAGTKFYLGSDSHSLDDFQKTVPQLRQMTHYLAQRNALALPGALDKLPKLV